jgi:hypothetical protein
MKIYNIGSFIILLFCAPLFVFSQSNYHLEVQDYLLLLKLYQTRQSQSTL